MTTNGKELKRRTLRQVRFWLCHRKRLIYAKIFFCGLTRKIQERQAFCERAYLESMKTSKTRSILQNFSVKNQPSVVTEPFFYFFKITKLLPVSVILSPLNWQFCASNTSPERVTSALFALGLIATQITSLPSVLS